jgi:hypothetical protein
MSERSKYRSNEYVYDFYDRLNNIKENLTFLCQLLFLQS